ncbi:uncharacterized protein LOC116846247 isoform X2 [Odontomachus brunneus]|uniref:uncharacterized protein LOC116846247 isoform X2 n=1 Tax=Odontomachus brunneus TaxID=486640 RepID=UPI0013F22A7B|nr:uncharacterized protein LOC116846247 isoform X2 [Odontomachus brunneus]
MNSYILVRGFIKTNFNCITINSYNFACGSITDGKFKLEIQIKDYDDMNEFEKGLHVDVKEYVKMMSFT